MAFETLKKDLIEAEADMKSYLETSDELFKLKIFKLLMVGGTAMAQTLLIGGMILLALFVLSIEL